MRHPIPRAALDDRLGFIGTSGSGKTYNAGTAIELLLDSKARVVIVDPLGVWWGLRLLADGKKASKFNVAIFGGPHGDLPLTEHAGALIGETAISMAESCIIDLSELKTRSAERRFMVAFLETMYRNAKGQPFHFVVDEADLFAPQKPQAGDEVLLGHMENIVRRGRVKGFIPWLITQRPAVLNKNVLSMVDGLLAFKLTSPQDRDALDAWIDTQGEKDKAKQIKDALPSLQIGTGIVWLPGHGILKTAEFPAKVTFDSSRKLKRGEKSRNTKALKPVDLGKLKDKLASIEAEAKASDPKLLKADIAKLQGEKKALEKQVADTAGKKVKADPDTIKKAEERGFEQATKKFNRAYEKAAQMGVKVALIALRGHTEKFTELLDTEIAGAIKNIKSIEAQEIQFTPSGSPPVVVPRTPAPVRAASPKTPRAVPSAVASGDGSLTPAKQRVLDAIAWMETIGTLNVGKDTLAFLADASPNSSAYSNNLGALRTAGLIEYPSAGLVALTTEGRGLANQPDAAPTHEAIMEKVATKLAPAQMRIVRETANVYPKDFSKEELAEAVGASVASSAYSNNLGRLRTLGLITYPSSGRVRADERLFP